MTQKQHTAKEQEWREIYQRGPDGIQALVEKALQDVLEAEMDEALGAQKSERTEARLGYRA